MTKTYYITYPTTLLQERLVDKIIATCKTTNCNWVSCYRETLAYSGRWCYVMSEEPLDANKIFQLWEYRNILVEDLKEFLYKKCLMVIEII